MNRDKTFALHTYDIADSIICHEKESLEPPALGICVALQHSFQTVGGKIFKIEEFTKAFTMQILVAENCRECQNSTLRVWRVVWNCRGGESSPVSLCNAWR